MKKLITMALMAFSLASCAQTSGNQIGAGYQIGDAAADFKLKNVDNKWVSPADYAAAKGFIVVFTCNTCPYALAYEDRIIALDKKYAAKGYPVIAINPNDPQTQPDDRFELMQERAQSKQFSFPYLSDPDHVVTKQFGATRTPHLFVLQKTEQGNVVQYIGAVDNDTENTNPEKEKYVEKAIDALLSGKKPTLNSTKAVGCTIKWKKAQS